MGILSRLRSPHCVGTVAYVLCLVPSTSTQRVHFQSERGLHTKYTFAEFDLRLLLYYARHHRHMDRGRCHKATFGPGKGPKHAARPRSGGQTDTVIPSAATREIGATNRADAPSILKLFRYPMQFETTFVERVCEGKTTIAPDRHGAGKRV